MRFTLRIDSEDAAAIDHPHETVVAALREVVAQLERWEGEVKSHGFRIRDVNGNTIGSWAIYDEAAVAEMDA